MSPKEMIHLDVVLTDFALTKNMLAVTFASAERKPRFRPAYRWPAPGGSPAVFIPVSAERSPPAGSKTFLESKPLDLLISSGFAGGVWITSLGVANLFLAENFSDSKTFRTGAESF